MTFKECSYLVRQMMSSRWYIDEMVYGEIGPNQKCTNHAIHNHFKQCNASYPQALSKAEKIIKDNFGNIVYPAPANFEELYARLEKLLKNSSFQHYYVVGVGSLVLYDIALHIGCNLYPRVLPEKYVYVHNNKVKDSAEVLLGIKIKGNRILTSAFKGIFDYFHAMEIENILCIYADDIKANNKFDNNWLNKIP